MNPSPNLFLIGPMGAGKSSLGQRLAAHFRMPCFDLDSAIEKRTGARIATIFDIEGEAGFRRRESALLGELATRSGIVLATGGGVVLAPANRELLGQHGFVLWLEVGVEEQLRRLRHNRQRPLLDVPDRRARLEQLAREREPLYRGLADFAVSATADEPCSRSASRIAGALERLWQRQPAMARTP
jgi:shikimate kinase